MTISLEAAEKISGLSVFGFGFGLVFVGLICLIIICCVMGAICKKVIKPEPVKPAEISKKLPEGFPDADAIPNKGEFIAAVSAALAEDLGEDVSKLRILSVKKL